jgi:hypothetical protein
MRHVLTGVAYVVALVLTASIASFAVLYLVGPHGGALPQSFYIPVLCVGWIAVIVWPIVFARWMWRRLRVIS